MLEHKTPYIFTRLTAVFARSIL